MFWFLATAVGFIHPVKPLAMKLICFMALLCLSLSSCGQSTSNSKPLNVGDTIPYIILTDVINFPVSKIQLPDTKTNLTILDFWATWCASCIKNFPKLDSFQTSFSGQLQVILVNNTKSTGNNSQQVTEFISNRKQTIKALQRLTVYTDTAALLKQLFPHKLLPHYVWISPSGTILAITSSAALTKENILLAISGKPLPIPPKME
jgi:thiol-disulfide isomerase/thioredoxin